jgi:hypothetical protein
MKRLCILSLAIILPACSSDDSNGNPGGGDDASGDSSTMEASTNDQTSPQPDGHAGDATPDVVEGDATMDAALDAGADGDANGGNTNGDSGEGGPAPCTGTWLDAPEVDPLIAVPDGGGSVILRYAASGTQDYMCKAGTGSDGGPSYTWSLVTPDAKLFDCHDTQVGHHFASEGGPGFPEWQNGDGYVIAQKLNNGLTPDGGTGIPWLVLHVVDAGGAGTLSGAHYIQRVHTDGGFAPSTGCAAITDVDASANVGYSADYYFYAP